MQQLFDWDLFFARRCVKLMRMKALSINHQSGASGRLCGQNTNPASAVRTFQHDTGRLADWRSTLTRPGVDKLNLLNN